MKHSTALDQITNKSDLAHLKLDYKVFSYYFNGPSLQVFSAGFFTVLSRELRRVLFDDVISKPGLGLGSLLNGTGW